MKQANTLQLDPAIFDRNLTALQSVEPELAAAVLDQTREDFNRPHAPSPANTRDGKFNFQLPCQDGRFEWLGRTSIPSVRAEAVIEKFDAGQGNVMVPRIGEGTELLLLINRLQRHRAIFAWEEELSTIQLVLHLHDYATAIAEGRLVFLHCSLDELDATLFDWLRRHPGHLCPSRIMLWPWQIPQDLSNCQAAVESAYNRCEETRTNDLRALHQQLNRMATTPAAINEPPLLAICSVRPDPDIWDVGTSLAADAQGQGYRPVNIQIRTPADVHPLARAQQMAANDRTPGWAVLLDITRQELGAILPRSLPAISWIGPNAPDQLLRSRKQNIEDPVAVTSDWLKEQALEADIPRDQIFVCPPPCLQCAAPEKDELTAERPIEVAMFGNLYSLQPQTYGYKLTTQIEIFKCMTDLLQARIEQYGGENIADILHRAEQKLGVRLEDPTLQKAMINTVQTWIAPALMRKFLAQAIIKKGFTLNIFGKGWPGQQNWKRHEPLITIDQKVQTLRKYQLYIHADLHGAVTADTMLAAGNGAVVLSRQHPRDERPGGMPALLAPEKEAVFFKTSRELTEKINQLLQNPQKRAEIALQACRRCHRDHRPATRLEGLKTAISSISKPIPGHH